MHAWTLIDFGATAPIGALPSRLSLQVDTMYMCLLHLTSYCAGQTLAVRSQDTMRSAVKHARLAQQCFTPPRSYHI